MKLQATLFNWLCVYSAVQKVSGAVGQNSRNRKYEPTEDETLKSGRMVEGQEEDLNQEQSLRLPSQGSPAVRILPPPPPPSSSPGWLDALASLLGKLDRTRPLI
jgi:hypothetical protein